jgi:AbrB family looped-hinge helix DNA binding protein
MPVATISQKGWVVIPAELREKYQWTTGEKVNVVDYGGVVALVPRFKNPEDQGIGVLGGAGRSLTRALERDRAKERRRARRRT